MTVRRSEWKPGVALGRVDRITLGLGRRGGAWVVALCLAAWVGGAAGADTQPASQAATVPSKSPSTAPAPTTQPITTASGEVGDLLRKWYAQGSAAGNQGDFYDNRDRGHSDLDTRPYPQLQRIVYTDEERKSRLDWAAQVRFVPGVVFGNSSTSAGVDQGGSNVRMYYVHPAGLPFLFAQYTHNNVYMYPEHVDYKPGHNGSPGYGDLYPVNTPYLITSQGSSGSDQPFMHAIPYTLAAFRPEVKSKLIQTGLLMPTLQMIFRISNKQLSDPKEYLTGKAHPTVFDGAMVNDLAMVKLAHEIELRNIPPIATLKVLEEDQPVNGKDYFEPNRNEKHADTPCVIGRIWRGGAYLRRMVVSAESSGDVNSRPLTFQWVVLRGDAAKITIKPMNKANSVAEITVAYQPRRPIAEGSKMESTRVDIGVFVNNGMYYSAPAFVCFFTLDDEARTYDSAGRAIEIGYGMGEMHQTVADWPALLDMLKPGANSLGACLLGKSFTEQQRAQFPKVAQEYRSATASVAAAREALNKAGADKTAAQKALDAATKAADEVLTKKRDVLPSGVKSVMEEALRAMLNDQNFYSANVQAIEASLQGAQKARQPAVEAARKKLVRYGLLKNTPRDMFVLLPILDAGHAGAGTSTAPSQPAAAPNTAGLTTFEKCLVQRFNAEILSNAAYPGVVNSDFKRNFVSPAIASPKSWRDVYHYDAAGKCAGWTRYDGEAVTEFNADGTVVHPGL